jgi:hypothetical protein
VKWSQGEKKKNDMGDLRPDIETIAVMFPDATEERAQADFLATIGSDPPWLRARRKRLDPQCSSIHVRSAP